MGSGRSGKFGNTRGAGGGGSSKKPSKRNKMPEDPSRRKHIFRKKDGHMTNETPENVKKLVDMANDDKYYRGVDKRGSTWHSKELKDGSQLWTESWNGTIRDGGLNKKVHPWNPETGLKQKVKLRNKK